VNKRAELVQAIQRASTFNDQVLAVQALDTYDRQRVAAAAQEREWDAAGAIVIQTMSPVAVHERHTAATDWMGELDTSGENYHQAMCAEAKVWFDRVDPMVKGDRAEFAEQALGMAQRTAGRYGEQANAAAQTFLDYVAFLSSKTGASGLPQIDQERNPKDDPEPTPLPTDVFSTFEDPIHPVNQGVEGTEGAPKEGAPLIDEIEGYGAPYGNGPEKPGGHSTSMDESGSYAEVPLGPPGQIPTTSTRHTAACIGCGHASHLGEPCTVEGCDHQHAEGEEGAGSGNSPRRKTSAYEVPTLAIGYHLGTLDDYRERFAREAANGQGSGLDFKQAVGPETAPYSHLDEKADGDSDDAKQASMRKGAPFAGYEDFAACVAANRDKDDPEAYCGKIKHQVEDGKKKSSLEAEGASSLPVQHQVIDPNNNPTPQADTFNTEVMFPLNPAFAGEESTKDLPAAENVAQAKRREFVAGLLGRAPQDWTPLERREVADYLAVHSGLVQRRADQWSAPHNVPGGETPISNSGQTTPQPASGAYGKGQSDGAADRAAGEAPTFSDASSHASDYVRGYSTGYAGADAPAGSPDVPYSMGGDAGQAQNAQDAQNAAQVAMSSKTAAQRIPGNGARLFGRMDAFEGKNPQHKDDFTFGPHAHGSYMRAWNEQRGAMNRMLGREPLDKETYAELSGRPDLYKHYLDAHHPDFAVPPEAGQPSPERLASKQKPEALKAASPLRVSAALVNPDRVGEPDFMKGYNFGRRWAAGHKLVSLGSALFEEGLYAGITDNPQAQVSWVAEHREMARQLGEPKLMQRISAHERVTRRYARRDPEALVRGFYVQAQQEVAKTAATSTDLMTMGPGASPDPMGSTPINGPGQAPPMEGGTDPARPGGPSPYNGAPPYGTPVAPDPVMGQTGTPQQDYPSAEQRRAAFKAVVQGNLAKMQEAS
jgi:hypothetical protein